MAVAHRAEGPPESFLSKPIIQTSPWIVLIVLGLGEYMILLDATVVNVAIPNMIRDLNASLDQILWVLNSYTLTFAVLLITAGRLGAMFGPRKLFIGGMLLFTVSSGACALSQTATQLILFRVLQAVGGAALTPQTLSIITSIFPPEKRGQAFGIWGVVYGLGGATGPTLGGLLTSGFTWRAIFVPNVPVGLIAATLAFLLMPELRIHARHRLDVVGVALATAGLSALIYGLVEGQKYGWGRITSTGAFDVGPIHASLVSIPTIFLASAILLILFPLWEARQEEPLLPLSLFHDRNFSLGCTVSAIQVFGMIGLYLPLVIFLQSVLHLTPVQSGVAVLPQAVGSFIAAPTSGRLADRINAKYILPVGFALYAIGLALIIWRASITSTGLTFTLPLIVLGLGVGMLAAPVVTVTMQNIVPSASGAASGFMNTIRQVGGALAAAVVGAVLQTRIASEQKSQAQHYAGQLPSQFKQAFVSQFSHSTGSVVVGVPQGAARVSQSLPAAVAHQFAVLGQLVSGHAYLNAMRASLLVPLGLSLLAILLTLVMRSARRVTAAAPEGGVPAGAALRAQELTAPAEATPAAEIPVPVFSAMNASDTIVLPVSLPRQFQQRRSTRAMRPPYLTRIGDGAERLIDDGLTIGRGTDNRIVVDDPRASRRHAQIVRQDGQYVVRDLQSANGTLLNGQPITQDRPLRNGDTIAIGAVSFVYHNDFEAARPRLTRVQGNGRDEQLINRPLSVGRSAVNDLVVDDVKVSRRHAQVAPRSGVIIIRDLNSLNGTKVNGELITGEHLLQDGDTVTFGNTAFVYHNDFEAAKSTLTPGPSPASGRGES